MNKEAIDEAIMRQGVYEIINKKDEDDKNLTVMEY